MTRIDHDRNNNFVCKFSLQNNFTHWVKYTSGNYTINLQGLIVDEDLDLVYLVGDVDRNTFYQAQVYQQGTYFPELGNSNVLILSYRTSDGILQWAQVLGEASYEDHFVSASVYAGIFNRFR